jgi:hypothetical protein
MTQQDQIMQGKICPYCDKPTEFVDSKKVYGQSYGMIYLCQPCDAYVGVHKGSTEALGRLANRELRYWKKTAHAAFDILWNHKINKGTDKHTARTAAYKWLSQQTKITPELCHIEMMDVDQCKKVVEICKPYAVKILQTLIKK